MVAQLSTNNELTIAPQPVQPKIEDHVFDDLAFLSQQIDEMFRLRDRGDDYAHTLAVVQQAVKGMATEFGMVREILNQQDESLKASGLKIHLVPLSA